MGSAIEVKNLAKNFGKVKAISNASFDIEIGKITGYIGPNGAGKTTTINILNGIVDKDEGEISIFGEKYDKNSEKFKYKMGYVPETQYIYQHLTLLEYLVFVGKIYNIAKNKLREKIDHYLDFFELGSSKNSIISSLSKGNKQKLLIISGILHDPDIIFFDEPMNGLDINGQFKFKDLLQDFKKHNKTIVYSSHIIEIIEKYAEKIIIINKGKILFSGTIDELLDKTKKSAFDEAFLSIVHD